MTQATTPHPAPPAQVAATVGQSAPVAPVPPAKTVWRDLNLLTKPRIALMVVITAFIGFDSARLHLNPDSPGLFDMDGPTVFKLIATLLGTTLSCMAAGIFNQVIERDLDAKMKRTADRPLPSRRVGRPVALLMGVVLTLLGLAILGLFANALTAELSALTIGLYALVYTPMKRYSSLCTIVGAFPGAMPPILGYAAMANTIGKPALVLFAILFVWQLPHFLAIAWLYKDEYEAAGMPMLPVIDDDYKATSRQILVGCLALIPLGAMPTLIGMAGYWYFFGSLIAGIGFLYFGILLFIRRTRPQARTLFFASIIYLPVVFGLVFLDRQAPNHISIQPIQNTP